MGKSTLHKHGPICGNEKGDISQNAWRDPTTPWLTRAPSITSALRAQPSPGLFPRAAFWGPQQFWAFKPGLVGAQTLLLALIRGKLAVEGSARLIGLSRWGGND